MCTYHISTNCPPPQAWYKDEALHEYLDSDLFHFLSFVIVVNCWGVDLLTYYGELKKKQTRPEKAEKETDKALNEPDAVDSPKSYSRRYITSEPRRYLAMFLCTLVFPVQFLHGSWVITTTWRFTVAILKATYPSIKPRILGFILYSPITLAIIIIWAAVLWLGLFFVVAQLLRVLELRDLELDIEPKTSEKVTEQLENEEWDEVEKSSEQREGEENEDKKKAN
ncbi:hypothetical protein ACHAPT_010488 [Fusarium lateritium]